MIMLNEIFTKGLDDWKKEIIILIQKEDTWDFCSYRDIIFLGTVSKIYESILEK